jgi:hypothetical protein
MVPSCGGSAAEAAEACYRRALRCAASQGSVMFELRASLALAQLWSRRGQGAEAAVLLGRAQGRIAQPAEGHDLAAATAFLAAFPVQSTRA